MNKCNWKAALVVTGAMLLAGVPALAAGFFTNGVPPAGGTQYPTTVPLTGSETLPADTNLPSGLNPASESISTAQLSQYIGGVAKGANVLIGGDATSNLFQRATSGASVTTALTYGGPDRWTYWSGTGTAMTVSRDSTAADLPSSGFQYGFKMARTSGQTGVVQVCMAQVVESAAAYELAGSTVELNFHATAGANLSSASSNMTAYIVSGTGSDEGSVKLAFGLNAGGGGSSGWTGQANATAAVIPITTTNTKYAAVATVPAAATEVGVVLCFTPVGTAGTNDYIALSGIQLVRNGALASKVSTTIGYSCTGGGFQCTAFDRTRLPAQEASLQYRYFYKIAEGSTITQRGQCFNSAATHANCMINFPVTMRATPVFTGDGGFTTGFATATTTAGTTLGACTALGLSTVLSNNTANTQNVIVACDATTVPAAGTTGFLYDNSGAGVIKASAEL